MRGKAGELSELTHGRGDGVNEVRWWCFWLFSQDGFKREAAPTELLWGCLLAAKIRPVIGQDAVSHVMSAGQSGDSLEADWNAGVQHETTGISQEPALGTRQTPHHLKTKGQMAKPV